jgi:hypothetical protein
VPRNGKLPRRPRCGSRALTVVAPRPATQVPPIAGGSPEIAAQPAAPAPDADPAPGPGPDTDPVVPPPAPLDGIDLAEPLEVADPVSVTVQLDTAAAQKQVIGPAGGSITVTHAGGGPTTLTIPPDALLGSEVIEVTPIASVTGLPFAGGLVQGVELKPHGLRFQTPVTLTFDTAQAVPLAEQTPLVAMDGGEDLHLYPLTADPSKLEMELMHFSEGMIASGTAAERTAQEGRPPANPEAQLEQKLQRAREAIRSGELSEEEAADVEDYLRAYWTDVVQPRLVAAEADETLAAVAIQSAFAWRKQLGLLGMTDGFDAELAEMLDRVETILQFAGDRAYERCRAGEIAWAPVILAIERQRQLIGFPEQMQEAVDRFLECVEWELSIEGGLVRYHAGSEPHTKTMRIATRIPLEAVSPELNALEGTADWEVVEWSIDDPHHCPWTPAGTEQLRAPRARILLQLDAKQVNDAVTGKAKAPPPSQPSLQLEPGSVWFHYQSVDCASGGFDLGWPGSLFEANAHRYVADSNGPYVFRGSDWVEGGGNVAWAFDQAFHHVSSSTSNYDLTTHIELRRPAG